MRATAIAAACRFMAVLPRWLPGRTRLARFILAALGDGPATVRGASGLTYEVPSLAEPIVRGIVASGVYEPDTIAAILHHLPEQGLFVDIGANIGAISLPVALARPHARILAVEAAERTFEVLNRNIQNNGLRITSMRAFVGATDGGVVPFFEAPESSFGMSSAGPQFNVAPIDVPLRSLDSLPLELSLPAPDVIKIDIEGAELQALMGASGVLRSAKPPVIVLEFCDWAEARITGQHPGDAQRFLLGCGYVVGRLSSNAPPSNAAMEHGTAMLVAIPRSAT